VSGQQQSFDFRNLPAAACDSCYWPLHRKEPEIPFLGDETKQSHYSQLHHRHMGRVLYGGNQVVNLIE
jgi:hypothetical protein